MARGLEPKGLLLLSILPWNRPHEAQKARLPEPSKSPEQLALIIYAFFPLRETFYVSTWASDHARSLFNDGGGSYDARHSIPEKPVKKILFPIFGVK